MDKETCKQILQRDMFRVNLEQGKAYSLIGEKVDTEEVLLELKEAFEREKQERIFCIDVSMQKQDRTDLSRRERYWILWREIMQQCSQCIPKEALEAIAGTQSKEVAKVVEKYELFRRSFPDNASDIVQDNNARKSRGKLLKSYTKLGIQIILIIRNFEVAEELFPKSDGEGFFYMDLFGLTPKSSDDNKHKILLVSEKRLKEIAHHMEGGSDIEAAYVPLFVR